MARIELAPEVAEEFERILDHLEQHQTAKPVLRIREIISAIDILEHNPLIGRPTGNDMRELVIGRDAHGYVALYCYLTAADIVFILAIRRQKEAGYRAGV